jgi:RNA polymerase sigma-70 factor (ECF subfamily)
MDMDATEFTTALEQVRPELTTYLRRLVVRQAVAEELMQETAVRAWEQRAQVPAAPGFRPWLFRVGTNLALDYLRNHHTFRTSVLTDARRAAEGNPAWARTTATLHGSPEMAAVAREHLVACFSCTLRQFAPSAAATLLLKEVYDFSYQEIADLLAARLPQVKNWLQQTRAALTERYAHSCALVGKQGVCYQCVELDQMYGAGRGDPLAGTPGQLDERLAIVRQLRAAPTGTWERLLADLLDEVGA